MDIRAIMQSVGLVGAGGAGFPSYAKIAEGADTLLINGSECEPLLYTDLAILTEALPTVLEGAGAVLDGAHIPRAVLAVKAHTAKRLSFTDGETLAPRITVRVLPNVYPIGDELSLIYEALGRSVAAGALPISAGVIVYNVETLWGLGSYLRTGEPITEKWLTVGGEIASPAVLRAPIGARVSDLFHSLGISVGEGFTVLDGGPSMGKPVRLSDAVVTKTTKGLLVLPNGVQAVTTKLANPQMAVARAETACCGCSRCTDLCPRHLLGYPLEPHKMVRAAVNAAAENPHLVLSATLCCGCGICESLACSQGISPRAVISRYKAMLAEKRLRYTDKELPTAAEERSGRMVPSGRWASMLGVGHYDRVAPYVGVIDTPLRVEIPLNRHIGLPSVPAVSDGDTVRRGELIAEAASGLSVPQHASIGGRVTLCDHKIIISKVRSDV